jgi:hypothetical protein
MHLGTIPHHSHSAFAGLFRHIFWRFLGSSSAESVMTMIYRSHRGVESLHNGTLEHTGHHATMAKLDILQSSKEICSICR